MNRSLAKHDHEKENNGVAIRYIAIGAALVIWSATWLLYLLAPELMSGWAYVAVAIVCTGLVMTFAGYQYIKLNREADRAEIDEAKELSEHERKQNRDRPVARPETGSTYEEYRVDRQLSSHA